MRRARASHSESSDQHPRSSKQHMVSGTMRIISGQKGLKALTYIAIIALSATTTGEQSPSLCSGDTASFEQQAGYLTQIVAPISTIQRSQLSEETAADLLSIRSAADVKYEVCCSSHNQTKYAAHAYSQMPTCSNKYLRKGSQSLPALSNPSTNSQRCIINQLLSALGIMLQLLEAMTALGTLCMHMMWLLLMLQVLCVSLKPATLYGRRNQYYTHATRPIGASHRCSVVICRRQGDTRAYGLGPHRPWTIG